MGILQQTGFVARVVLAILFLFSLISWAMIFQKWGMFGRVRRQSAHFLQNFLGAHGVANPHPPKLKSLAAVTVSMQLQSAEEVRRVEKGMAWLATTGSVTPFIGLFGTVWGIIDAFAGLGSAGAASLRAVAPGIAEALITTAAGLATAIPAVIFYNQFLQNIRDLAQRLDNFAMEVTSQVEKAFN